MSGDVETRVRALLEPAGVSTATIEAVMRVIAEECDRSYVAGKEMERTLMRLRLGLGTDDDRRRPN